MRTKQVTIYFLPTVEIIGCNIMINGGHDYATGCLLHYPYFKKHFKVIAIDLGKQQELDADPKAIQQINFTGNLD